MSARPHTTPDAAPLPTRPHPRTLPRCTGSTAARPPTTRTTRPASPVPSRARYTCAPSPSSTASPSSCTPTTACARGSRALGLLPSPLSYRSSYRSPMLSPLSLWCPPTRAHLVTPLHSFPPLCLPLPQVVRRSDRGEREVLRDARRAAVLLSHARPLGGAARGERRHLRRVRRDRAKIVPRSCRDCVLTDFDLTVLLRGWAYDGGHLLAGTSLVCLRSICCSRWSLA